MKSNEIQISLYLPRLKFYVMSSVIKSYNMHSNMDCILCFCVDF